MFKKNVEIGILAPQRATNAAPAMACVEAVIDRPHNKPGLSGLIYV
jgi:hypothetical protein